MTMRLSDFARRVKPDGEKHAVTFGLGAGQGTITVEDVIVRPPLRHNPVKELLPFELTLSQWEELSLANEFALGELARKERQEREQSEPDSVARVRSMAADHTRHPVPGANKV